MNRLYEPGGLFGGKRPKMCVTKGGGESAGQTLVLHILGVLGGVLAFGSFSPLLSKNQRDKIKQ
jgi:hypothetical protein